MKLRPAKLSPVEKEIVRRLADGETVATIAEALGKSPKTVEYHSNRARLKIGSASIAILTRYAIAEGIIECDVHLTLV